MGQFDPSRNRYVDDLKGSIPMSKNNQATLSATIPECNGTATSASPAHDSLSRLGRLLVGDEEDQVLT